LTQLLKLKHIPLPDEVKECIVYDFQKAAAAGSVESEFLLGICHKLGFGVDKNAEAGHGMISKAASKGCEDAQGYLKTL